MTLRTQQTMVSAGALFVLVAVMLPAIVYMGHWGAAAKNHDHAGEIASTAHEDHCHIGPAKCFGGVSMVGTWWVGEDPVSIEPDTMPSVIAGEGSEHGSEGPAQRIFQPPQFV